MENIRKILLLTSCLFITLGTYAQSINVTGKVIDEEGLEVIGANISVKGSAGVGTITDLNGQYTLKVNNQRYPCLFVHRNENPGSTCKGEKTD